MMHIEPFGPEQFGSGHIQSILLQPILSAQPPLAPGVQLSAIQNQLHVSPAHGPGVVGPEVVVVVGPEVVVVVVVEVVGSPVVVQLSAHSASV
jgi:hypothetical protein